MTDDFSLDLKIATENYLLRPYENLYNTADSKCCRFGGLFLFLPYLAGIPLEEMLERSQVPGSQMVPAAHAVRFLLALKIFGNARRSYVMSHVFDEGLALFAGLNVIPKRSFLTEYSCRIYPDSHPFFPGPNDPKS